MKEQYLEIKDNYELGLITEHEFKHQVLSILTGGIFQSAMTEIVSAVSIETYTEIMDKAIV